MHRSLSIIELPRTPVVTELMLERLSIAQFTLDWTHNLHSDLAWRPGAGRWAAVPRRWNEVTVT